MAFNVGDIVKKVGGQQRYEVVTVLTGAKYECKLNPETVHGVKFTFQEENLELA